MWHATRYNLMHVVYVLLVIQLVDLFYCQKKHSSKQLYGMLTDSLTRNTTMNDKCPGVKPRTENKIL